MCRVAGTGSPTSSRTAPCTTPPPSTRCRPGRSWMPWPAYDPSLPVLGQPGSVLLRVAESAGLPRRRRGVRRPRLRPRRPAGARSHPRALLHDPGEVAERVLRIVTDGTLLAVDGTAGRRAGAARSAPTATPRARSRWPGRAGPARGRRRDDHLVRRPACRERRDAGGVAVEVLPVGDEGLLLEVADLDAVLALEAALRGRGRGGPAVAAVTDVVPAARTVLLLPAERRRPRLALRAAALAAGRLRASCAAVPRPVRAPETAGERTRSRSPCATTGPTSTTSPPSPA